MDLKLTFAKLSDRLNFSVLNKDLTTSLSAICNVSTRTNAVVVLRMLKKCFTFLEWECTCAHSLCTFLESPGPPFFALRSHASCPVPPAPDKRFVVSPFPSTIHFNPEITFSRLRAEHGASGGLVSRH